MTRLRNRSNESHDVPRGYTTPVIVVAAPLRHAVDIGNEILLRLRQEFIECPEDRIFHQAADLKPPILRADMRLNAEIEDRPVLDLFLPRRQTIDAPHIGAAGQQSSLFRPLLFGADQFVSDLSDEARLFVFVCHPLTRINRALLRAQSRAFSVSRLSCSFLPRARPSSIFATPF